LKVKLES